MVGDFEHFKDERELTSEEIRDRNSRAILQSRDIINKQGLLYGGDGVVDFDQRTRDRTLFVSKEPVGNSIDEKHLAIHLFGTDIEKDGTVELHERIDDKNVLLIGGGRSMEDLTSSSEFHPKSVVNVDPFLPSESIDRGKASYYRSLPLNALDKDFAKELKHECSEGFDEIWATHSLPNYCNSKEEVEIFFRNIKDVISPGGNLRIFPLTFYLHFPEKPNGKELGQRTADLLNGWLAGLRENFNHDDEYEIKVEAFSPKAETLVIHRKERS